MNTTSHTNQIHEYLRANGSITPLDAINEFGCYRLGARIFDLRRQGIHIRTEMVYDEISGYTPAISKYARCILS